jgi:hypothetical protein
MSETITKVAVTIISANTKEKIVENVIETDTLLSATRIMNTFKPKRGYKVVQFMVQDVEVLV